MRRWMMGLVVVGIVLSAGVSFAQTDGPPAMPEKVRKYLEWQIGTWNVAMGEDVTKATTVYKWAPGETCVVGEAEVIWRGQPVNFIEVIAWDGVSKDGIMGYFVNQRVHESHPVKIVSDTVSEGTFNGIRFGQPYAGKERVVKQGPDQYTIFATEIVHGGQPRPDEMFVFTRVKSTDDEQELRRLYGEASRAVKEKDLITAFTRLTADDYVETHADGKVITRTEILEALRANVIPITDIVFDDLNVQSYGNTAVVTGQCVWSARDGSTGLEQFTDTWLKRDGRWQTVASHSSEIDKTVDSAKLSDEMKKLAAFVGTWRYEGEQVDPPVAGLPFGGAGAFSGTITSRFILGGRFLQQQVEDKNPGGITHTVTITGYDPSAGHYVANMFVSDGSRQTSVETVSPDGLTWTTKSTMTTTAGQTVPVRTVVVFSSDRTRLTATTEVSPDNGKTWKHWYKDEARKVND